MSGITKLLNLLEKGNTMTTKEIRRRTGLQDPSTAVRDLRNLGYDVNTVRATRGNKPVFKYQLAA